MIVIMVMTMTTVMVMARVQWPLPAVCTAFRLKRLLHAMHTCAQPFHHFRQYMVGLDQNSRRA